MMMDAEVFIAIENEAIVGLPAIGIDDRIRKHLALKEPLIKASEAIFASDARALFSVSLILSGIRPKDSLGNQRFRRAGGSVDVGGLVGEEEGVGVGFPWA